MRDSVGVRVTVDSVIVEVAVFDKVLNVRVGVDDLVGEELAVIVVTVNEGVRVTVMVPVSVTVNEGVPLGEVVLGWVKVAVGVEVAVEVADGVIVQEEVGVRDRVGVRVEDAVADFVAVV